MATGNTFAHRHILGMEQLSSEERERLAALQRTVVATGAALRATPSS